MSYVLKFWEPPQGEAAPKDVYEADDLVDRLENVWTGQNPKFLALAERLTSRFPCITSPQAALIPNYEWAWSEGPIDGRTEEGVYSIGLRSSKLSEVRPFVVKQAGLLGLGVLDTQAGQAFLPDGRILEVKRVAVPSQQPSRPKAPPAREVAQEVFSRLQPLLKVHGFNGRKSDLTFRCDFGTGWHIAHILMSDFAPLSVEFELFIKSRLNTVSELYAAIIAPEKTPEETAHWESTVLGQPQWMKSAADFINPCTHSYKVTTREQLAEALDHLASQWNDVLWPALEQYKTIEGLDRLLNTQSPTDSIFFKGFYKLEPNILGAYLSRSPRLDELCDYFLANIKEKPHLETARKCADYVRSHPAA